MFAPTRRIGLSALTLAALTACGGSNKPTAIPPVTPAAPQIIGTAALGAALPGAAVRITTTAGTAACAEPAVTTDTQGDYACTLTDGASAPYIVVVIDDQGRTEPLVSVGLETPVPDGQARINATPLTTAIVAQLSPDDDALAVVDDPTLLDVETLAQVRDKVLAQLAEVLQALGVPDLDPFTTELVAATPSQAGNAADALIEAVRVSRLDGQIMMAPVHDPAAAVPVADAATVEPQALPAPSDAAADLAAGLRALAQRLNDCFALPVAQRVLARDDGIVAVDGGPEVTSLADGCAGLADASSYLGQGRRFGQAYHALLTDEAMTGAKFDVPAVLQVLPDAEGQAHQAIVRLSWTRSDGQAGSFFDLARRLAQDVAGVGSTGSWVVHGNQQRLQSSVAAVAVRRDQLAPGAGSGSGLYGNAANSRYETGLNLYVNKDGPGSAGLRAVRATGPGLPPAGVVLTRPDPSICTNQDWLNVRRKDGLTDPVDATYAGNGGNRLTLQRTQGLEGELATTRRTNPNEGNTNNTAFVNWAHPLDYGFPAGSTDYIDFSRIRALATYTFEFFFDGELTPRYTYPKSLLTDFTPATRSGTLRWLVADAQTRRLLDPTDALAAETTAMTLSWTPDPLAAPVGSLGVYTGGPGVRVNQGRVTVPPGATSAVAEVPQGDACGSSASFPALVDDGAHWRLIQLRQRRLDNHQQDSFVQFN